MFKPFAAATLLAVLCTPALAAEPIVGTWRLTNGETVDYKPCGAKFCSTVNSGAYKGKTVGTVEGSGTRYTGTVVDPSSDKSYDGRVEITGDKLVLTGCVAKVFCRSQTWTRAGKSG
ncbi:DUF2147 domain-containing protein [Aureimonas sp. AU22]|jgi:uncharacterized protein (DUF2147 family)|uniref:DUF2147 domain-containing protein n=1 Tax=Aureimonas sp. AU22 TaxID=1638162 RepID=UPI0007806527|nr:DUF2147 domain-containing protein [Aureimonas sp. AU22]